MKKITVIALLTVLLAGLSSCTTTKFGGLQMTKEMPSFQVVAEFETVVNVTKFLGSSGGSTLLNIGSDSAVDPVYDAVQREIGKLGGDAAVNVEITYGATLMQLLANGITGYLYAPSTVTITGTVVKY